MEKISKKEQAEDKQKEKGGEPIEEKKVGVISTMSPMERIALMEKLAGNEVGMEIFKEGLKDKDERVRETAAECIGKTAAKGVSVEAVVGGLVGALQDKSVEVRKKAAWALSLASGKGLGEKATEALKKALDDAEPDVRFWAAMALVKEGYAGEEYHKAKRLLEGEE